MAAYVDKATWRKPGATPRSPNYCHLVADTLEELHQMAETVGLSRGSFQNTRYPHYDLTEKRRAVAIENGALEVSSREIVAKAKFLAAEREDKIARNDKKKSTR